MTDVAGELFKRKQRSRAAAHAVDNRPAIERLHSAYSDLKAAGWGEIMYAPKDGTEVEIIECGSVGIHRAVWHSFHADDALNVCGSWFIDGEYPSDPILFRLIKATADRSRPVQA